MPFSTDSFADHERGGGLVLPFGAHQPRLGEGIFLAPQSTVIGNVVLGNRVSIWFGTVVRGDIAPIQIGDDSNIQDNSVVHVGDLFPCIVGSKVVVGHRAILHGCRIADATLIGMGATLLNGVTVGERSIIAAGALLTERMIIPPDSLVVGMPAKIIKTLDPSKAELTIQLADKYARVAGEYLQMLNR